MTAHSAGFLFCFALSVIACSDDAVTSSTGNSTSASTGGGVCCTGTGTGTGAAGAGGQHEGGSAQGGNGTGGAPCPLCAEPVELSPPQNGNIQEASGLAASANHAGIYYVHNDSGDSARFFAITENGADNGTFNVSNAAAIDWEDMERGPCADKQKSCLYFGDIGDNNEARSDYVVYRVEEPAKVGPGTSSLTAEALPFAYPDGSHNAEALMVHPTTGELYIVTKKMGDAKLYQFPEPLDGSSRATLVLRGSVNVPGIVSLATSAAFRPGGGGVILRTYTSVWYYPIANGQSVADSLAAVPCDLPAPSEGQGESVTFAPDGHSYRTISEGNNEPLFKVDCSPR